MNLSDVTKQSDVFQQAVAETMVADMIDQMDIFDPAEETDALFEALAEVDEKEAKKLISFLLGVTDLDEYLETLLETLTEDDEDDDDDLLDD